MGENGGDAPFANVQEGDVCNYDPEYDDRKGKYKAVNVSGPTIGGGGGGGGGYGRAKAVARAATATRHTVAKAGGSLVLPMALADSTGTESRLLGLGVLRQMASFGGGSQTAVSTSTPL